MRLYARRHLLELEPGSSGRKRNLLDVARFLKFAVHKCGADKKWLPLEADDLKELIGHRQTAPKANDANQARRANYSVERA